MKMRMKLELYPNEQNDNQKAVLLQYCNKNYFYS
jgi:hypothetical protein